MRHELLLACVQLTYEYLLIHDSEMSPDFEADNLDVPGFTLPLDENSAASFGVRTQPNITGICHSFE